MVVESYTKQLKQSGYDYKETKEIIQSGYIGMARKIERRKELGIPMHREGRTTVLYRARKKILDKKMWYRKEREEGNDTEKKGGGNKIKYNRGRDRQREHRKEKEKTEIKSVVFVQQTKDSKLIKKLREAEEKLGETTGYRIKFVEKVGEKLVDILCQSNPWKGNRCNRDKCLLCDTKEETGKGKKQACNTRNITYETWCGTCEDKEKERIEKEMGEEDNTENRKEPKGGRSRKEKEVRLHKYVGETGRSAFERGKEHLKDRDKWDKGSHILKHIVLAHEGEKEEKVRFRMKIVRTHRSAFERQIFEGIRIQSERKIHDILNSKTEYNRCALPRIEINVGNGKNRDKKKERIEEERKEAEVEKKIENLKRKTNRKEGREKEEKKEPERVKPKGDTAKDRGGGLVTTGLETDNRDRNTVGNLGIQKGSGHNNKRKRGGGKEKGEESIKWDSKKENECRKVCRKEINVTNNGCNKERKSNVTKNDITQYVTISEKREMERVNTKNNPLEDNWELALRIREILSENDEKWRNFEKEREEEKARMVEKERRFEVIREKKRKWEDKKSTQDSKETETEEKKKVTHHEMWWKIFTLATNCILRLRL